MTDDYREILIQGLLERLGRYARGTYSQRKFIVEELTHLLSCAEVNNERT